MRATAENRPAEPIWPYTAGTPANERVAGKARERIVTVSPAVQPPATPRTRTVRPRRTVVGLTASALSTALVRVLTSRPLATTIASPTSPRFPVDEALRTSDRPRLSVTQRHAVPPLPDADQ